MSHTYTNILIHALFSTRGRQPWLVPKMRDETSNRNREEHHRKVSFIEEVVAFLDQRGVEYDPRYVSV